MAVSERDPNPARPQPQYRKDAKYPGHQLIEALPDIPTTEEAYEALLLRPTTRPSGFRGLPTHRKLDLHGELRLLFLPTAEHVAVLQKIVRAIRDGLAYRDIKDPRVQAALYRSAEGKGIGLSRLNPTGGGCLGLLLQGVTGSGKTSFLDRLVAYLTRDGTQSVIWHREINGRRCSWPQITCLRIQCQKSIKATVAELAAQVDRLLGTSHRKRLNSRMETGLFLALLSEVLSIHFVGLLIVEDMQKLRTPEQAVLEFFCDLMEESGIPVLLVSTYKFRATLTRDPTLLSKLTAGGELDFGLMTYDPGWTANPDPENDDWTPFVKELWELNTFSKSTPMPGWLPGVVHFHTQGIRRITRELFVALFDRCAYVEPSKVTEALIDDIAETELAKYQAGLTALRRVRIQGEHISDVQAELVEHFLPPLEAVKLLQVQVKARKAAKRAVQRTSAPRQPPSRKKTAGQHGPTPVGHSRAKAPKAKQTHTKAKRRVPAAAGASAVYASLKQSGKVIYPGGGTQ